MKPRVEHRKKYKALILKYVPCILKYMAYIFHEKPCIFKDVVSG